MAKGLEVEKDKANAVLDYTKNNYSIVQFLRDKGLWNESGTLKCPFHPETNPSFRVDIDKNVYHCFSCESKGSFINLYHDYRTKVDEDTKGFFYHVQELLENDKKMQSVLGFKTIFKDRDFVRPLEDIINYKYKAYKPKIVEVRTYQILMNKLETIEDKITLIGLIEQGFSVDYCWSKLILKQDLTDEEDAKEDDNLKKEFEEAFSEDNPFDTTSLFD